ncbi:dTDP-4-dehydrorhamnose reductase [Paenibacillus thermoaerophilus]|uniref:dTDP-4-dehydrorhamnose reductase n=1 Tax=Paenibacillus thermoaerophilus TaxID=1215385 RepID=A0ABW2V2A7_9BACL|nr:dTDP-4-dehydrorhamnose reductase [Paenibacillus thermoaerophilus]TMV17497.1 dTDP-4-dehydrorhamnose reductase [Paenibacillus thermoaerophilus]
MRVLLVGGYGLLGTEIFEQLQKSVTFEVIRFDKSQFNLLDKDSIHEALSSVKPDIVIHAAGYTNVEKAEDDFREAFEINCQGLYYLIDCLKATCRCPLLYFSTDYVFDGQKRTPYKETDRMNPLNRYGWTKALSEDIIRANYKEAFIIRTAWLFGNYGKCFPKTIIKKLQESNIVPVINDQFGSPTYTADVAKCISQIFNLPYGTYHVVNSGMASWYDFAMEIAELLNLDKGKIVPVQSGQFGLRAKRPSYSVLDNTKWSKLSKPIRHYKDALKDYISTISI